jgi:ABC-type multidrug transport system fused ATPase/permease subunit
MSAELLPIASAGETTRLAWRLMASHRWRLVATGTAFALAGASAMVAPWVLGSIVDAVRDGADPDVVTRLALVIGGAAVLGGLFTALSVALLARTAEPALAELREDALDAALHLDAARIERAGTGDLMSRAGDDVRTVGTALNEVVPLLVTSLVAVVFTAVGLFALDWRLGLAGLVAGPFYVLGLRWYLPRSGPSYRRERTAQGERAQALVSGLQGAATLRAFAREGAQMERIGRTSSHAAAIAVDVFRLMTRFFARNNRAELIGLAAVLGTGFLLVRSEEATVGAVTAAALYFHRLFNPIGALMILFDEVQSTGASLARLAGVAGLKRVEQPAKRLAERGDLVLSGIRHEYVPGRPVLTSADLRLAPGERVALVGATGAGKTTLGAIAAGVLDPTHGEVTLSGEAYADLGPRTVRAHVSLISQDVHVFAGTVREAVTLVRADATDAEIRASLEAALAWGWVQALPERLETVVGDHGHPLTPAQAQQLALARIVLHDPWVVVLDEATAEAGSSGAHDLEQAALAVTAGRTALVVAHRLTQAQSADRVLVLHEGRVVEQGTHEELLVLGGRYAALWGAWSATGE